jgi:exopolyphosphatase/guanosine-5'-triphosphate,3'-diphosphate pyrophosphatase
MRESGLPDDFAPMLRQGADLDEVQRRDRPMEFTSPPPPRRESDAARYEAVCRLAGQYHYEREHTHQVTRLALALFDELAPAHGLGEEERFLLQCGALLHDIGWTDGRKGHHKTAQRLIHEARDLPLDDRERLVVSLVARYHRKALPSPSHEEYAALEEAERRRVDVLAGIVRVADGLDRSHLGVVQGVRCDVSPEAIRVRCVAEGPAATEVAKATQKGDLLQQVLERRLVIERDRPQAP